MTPDYSKCSVSELQDILRVMDGQAHPENKAAAEAELEKRLQSDEYRQQQADAEQINVERHARKVGFAQSAVPVIAWFLMATAPVFVFFSSVQASAGQDLAAYAITGVSFLYGGCCYVAGYGLRKQTSWGYDAAIFVLAIQAVSVASGKFLLTVLSVFGFYFIVDSTGNVGFRALYDPGLTFIANPGSPLEFGFNLFAILLIWLLIIAGDNLASNESGNTQD